MASNAGLSLPILSSAILPRYQLRPCNASDHHSRLPFYKLPPELRKRIYEYIFADSMIVVAAVLPGPRPRTRRTRAYRRGVLFVSRLTYAEARIQYYQSSHYDLSWVHNFADPLPHFIQPHVRAIKTEGFYMPATTIQSVLNLKNVYVTRDWGPWTAEHTVKTIFSSLDRIFNHSERARNLEVKHKHLKTALVVSIEYGQNGHGCELKLDVDPPTQTITRTSISEINTNERFCWKLMKEPAFVTVHKGNRRDPSSLLFNEYQAARSSNVPE